MVWIAISGVLPLSAAALQFQEPQAVAEPQRMAWTPKLDGKRSEREWDSYAGTGASETFFQWEPGRLYLATSLAENENVILTVDARSNGWLVGNDNLEFRVRMREGAPILEVQQLDATNPSGPTWLPVSHALRNTMLRASADSAGTFLECSIDTSGIPQLFENERKLAIRIDKVLDTDKFEPYLPRTMSQADLVMERGSNLPGGLKWSSLFSDRIVIPGEDMRIRFHFNGQQAMNLVRLDIDPSQSPDDAVAKMSYPFPAFDSKGHSVVEFVSPVPASAETGYRIVRAVLADASGNSTFLRSSFRVAPRIECSMNTPKDLKVDKIDRRFRFTYYVHNNARKRSAGDVEVKLPAGWTMEKGDKAKFAVFNSFDRQKRTFEAIIPANAQGDFPVKLVATTDGKIYESTGWISIRK